MGLTGSVDPKQKEMIQRACERTGSLIALINDLLRYSRLEAETGVPAVYQPVSLFDVVRRTVELLSPSAEEKGLHLEVHLRPVHVLADEEGLTELVTNLVSNAIRYTPNGGRVSVAIEVEGPHAMLKVEDQGIGIKPDDLPHLFEEFFRSESARQFVRHGTGMGLAIVKKLVDSYGGAIDVASEPGRGTTFTVRLPLAPAE
jgi:signal transduction histidine kinase